MNLTTIAGHSFDLDRLPEKPYVLDVGCRGFDFVRGIRTLRPGAHIWAMDPDPIIEKPNDAALCAYLQLALVAPGSPRRQRYALGSTGEGNFLTEAITHSDYAISEVDCVDIAYVTSLLPSGKRWDLVKLDCEGSEFGILEAWPGPIAWEISVEFHDWHGTHVPKRDWKMYYGGLFEGLGKMGYRVVQHELSDISGRGAWGHWDSLLVLEA